MRFLSRRLTKPKRPHSSTEKEYIAILWAIPTLCYTFRNSSLTLICNTMLSMNYDDDWPVMSLKDMASSHFGLRSISSTEKGSTKCRRHVFPSSRVDRQGSSSEWRTAIFQNAHVSRRCRRKSLKRLSWSWRDPRTAGQQDFGIGLLLILGNLRSLAKILAWISIDELQQEQGSNEFADVYVKKCRIVHRHSKRLNRRKMFFMLRGS